MSEHQDVVWLGLSVSAPTVPWRFAWHQYCGLSTRLIRYRFDAARGGDRGRGGP